MVKNCFRHFNYKGPSMNPTLKVGDGLTVLPYADIRIRVGDVIVFRPPGIKRHVTHRVVYVDIRGMKTKGDHNRKTDQWTLRCDEIIGRVVCAHRGSKSVPIYGGRWGALTAWCIWIIKGADTALARMCHPIYERLVAGSIFRRALPRRMKPRKLCFTGSNGSEMQLIMGKWLIGRRKPGESWRIRRPFGLFVNIEY